MSRWRKLFDRSLREGIPVLAEIEAFDRYAKSIGHSEYTVFDEKKSDLLHIDLYPLPATKDFPYLRIHSTGAAGYKMPHIPGETPFFSPMVVLPADWPSESSKLLEGDGWWPYKIVRMMAKMPVDCRVPLGEYHSVPIAEPGRVMAGTDFTSVMLVKPSFLPLEQQVVRVDDNRTIALYCIVPLFHSEHQFQISQSDPSVMWNQALAKGRDPLELCIVRADREPMV